MDLKKALFSIRPALAATALERAGVRPGLYHYVREEGRQATRFHLRVDGDGSGVLVAGATAAARLHPSGVIIAKGLLEGQDEQAVLRRLAAVFRDAAPRRAAADVAEVRRMIGHLSAPGDTYPIINLDDPAFLPDARHWDRPLSADVPLAEPERIEPILARLWDFGIPHVTLVAGDEPDPAALVRAVEKAEDLGLIAGVRGRGSVLGQGSLIDDLARAGVDHVNVLYLAADAHVHDVLAGAGDHAAAVAVVGALRAVEVCPVVEIALVERTFEVVEQTVASLEGLEVRNAAFYAIAMTPGKSPGGAMPAHDLVCAARVVEDCSAEADVRFLWYPPLRFRLGRSLAAAVVRGPRTSGDTAIRVEPDGSVLLARGPCRSAGNLLRDSWDQIARSDAMRRYRKRLSSDTHCGQCPGLAICAADCPRDPEGWAEPGKE